MLFGETTEGESCRGVLLLLRRSTIVLPGSPDKKIKAATGLDSYLKSGIFILAACIIAEDTRNVKLAREALRYVLHCYKK